MTPIFSVRKFAITFSTLLFPQWAQGGIYWMMIIVIVILLINSSIIKRKLMMMQRTKFNVLIRLIVENV